jgi:glucokinase
MAEAVSKPGKTLQGPPTGFSAGPVLLGDIGATNARFAVLSDGRLGAIKSLAVAEFSRFIDAVGAFLEGECRHLAVKQALLAAAGLVDNDRCVLTNRPWTIDVSELRAAFGFARIRLCNDFEATAWSLPHLKPEDLYPLGNGRPVRGAPAAVLGPGTGLGVACFIPGSQGSLVITSEGGHATMSPVSLREDAIIDWLRRRFGHVSAERVSSGAGLENLYRAVIEIDRVEAPERDAAGITRAALEGSCPTAKAALELFCAMLGTIAGNAALMFGARGGVYIAGGIVPRITDFMARSEFRARFEAKGRLATYVKAIPSSVIVHPAATFVGLKVLAKNTPET